MLNRIFHIALYKRYTWYLCVAIFLFSLIYLVDKYELNDFVHFGPDGDMHEYQCLAVNLVSGHGYKVGWIEDFSHYKFTGSPDDITLYRGYRGFNYYYDNFIKPQYSFYRTPGYPFFIAAIYKLFGIHPRNVKIVQVILFAFAVASMPLLGRLYWNKAGVVSGAITSFVLLRNFCPDPGMFLPEPLTVFSLVVWAFLMTAWERRTTYATTLCMGMASAWVLLLRGSNALLVIFFLIYLLCKMRTSSKKFRIAAMFIFTCLIVLLPWSIYASVHGGKLILLSTQLRDVLFVGNNETTMFHGGYSNEWLTNSSFFYYKLKDSAYSAPYATFLFLFQNKHHILQLLGNKLQDLFSQRSVFVAVAGMLLYYYIYLVRAFFRRVSGRPREVLASTTEKVPLFPLLFFVTLFLNTMISFSYIRYILVFMFSFILPAVYALFYIIKSFKAVE